MELRKVYEILQDTSLGQDLNNEELQRLAEIGTMKTVDTGTILMREGDNSDALIVLLEGETEVLKGFSGQQPRQVAKQKKGSVLGEMGLFLQRPRKATVRTLTPCKVFVFQQGTLGELREKNDILVAKIAMNLGYVVSQKLEILNENVVDLLNNNEKLLTTIESLDNSQSKSDLESMRTRLLSQAKQLRQSQEKVEKQLNYLNTEINQTKLIRRVAELVIAIVTGGVATFGVGQLIGVGINQVQLPIESDQVSPSSIPYINTEEDCKKRDGSIWHEEQCWDFTHSPDW
ncbi:cyclic nucleotide-binding domain-containing protein [Crocosphaera sp.]|uniref:cyclic nucleotide-binding domain-containing protein n=1 Tax=Crocosphaera sp. TaxID=2729996 RepID=UPI00261B57B7|nr:cyclic nucleotide-binding domain-containing protein [Crocosphaera sp.]MDJ0579983.1 cyclic nucleotide-binding domain-containing protein [Crocosphaera sp.]